jgi:hypothetical protein
MLRVPWSRCVGCAPPPCAKAVVANPAVDARASNPQNPFIENLGVMRLSSARMMPPMPAVLRLASFVTGLMLPVVASAQNFSVDSTSCAARLAGPSPAAMTTSRDTSSARVGDADSSKSPAAVILFAAASAREVTFAKVPEIRVRLCGGFDSAHVVDRRNLPTPVVTGRTYRDVYVAVEIFGRLNADCIVAALTSAPRDSTGQRNACASLEIGGTRTKPPELR